MPKPRPIIVVRNFGGKRLAAGAVPNSCADWSRWECDPSPEFAGRKPSRGFAWGSEFPWHFDKEEKAFVVEGGATLTPDDIAVHGDAITIGPRDLVTFPRGWVGTWSNITTKLVKYYAFFDGKGLRVDEASDDDEEDVEDVTEGKKAPGTKQEMKMKREREAGASENKKAKK